MTKHGSPLRNKYLSKFRVPNCGDPVFRAWCKLCDLTPGDSYDRDDPRLDELDSLMARMRGCQDDDDDEYYLLPRDF